MRLDPHQRTLAVAVVVGGGRRRPRPPRPRAKDCQAPCRSFSSASTSPARPPVRASIEAVRRDAGQLARLGGFIQARACATLAGLALRPAPPHACCREGVRRRGRSAVDAEEEFGYVDVQAPSLQFTRQDRL